MRAAPDKSLATCAVCRGPLPIDHAAYLWPDRAAYLWPDGSRTCLGTCRPLYLFKSGNPDWVVAHDEEDANRVWCGHVGEDSNEYEADEWERLADDYTAKYWLDPETGHVSDDGDGNELVELTALEVINRFGRGFVASVDF